MFDRQKSRLLNKIIRLPKGSEALSIASISHFKEEDEVLVNSGIALRLLQKTFEKGTYYYEVEGVKENE